MNINHSKQNSQPVIEDNIEACWTLIRKQTSKNLPLEAAYSLPVPSALVSGQRSIACFFYKIRRTEGITNGFVLPPIARILATYPEGRILSFVTSKTQEIFPGLPSEGELGSLAGSVFGSPSERMRQKHLLFESYQRILASYWSDKNDAPGKDAFLNSFKTFIEPGLYPFYTALNPAFFEWLEK